MAAQLTQVNDAVEASACADKRKYLDELAETVEKAVSY